MIRFGKLRSTLAGRNLYLRIIGGISLIVLLSLLGSWLLITATSYFFSFVCLVIILLITLFLTRLMNGVNRQVSLFFESLRSHDSSLRYPENSDDPLLRDLHAGMNRVTALFSENRKEMEESRIYYESILRVLTHEMRNSMTPICSLSDDLLRYPETDTPGRLRDGLEVIRDQAKTLSVFLDSYHRLTHLPMPERQEIGVSSLFRKLDCLLCAERGSERVQYRSPEGLVLLADPNLVVLALINLVRNALFAVEGRTDGKVLVEAIGIPGAIQITVTDNGPGIPSELLTTIFTPFFTTKSGAGGSGIGLSLSLRIMRLHGGDLRVVSIPEVQTVFTLVFPSYPVS